MSCRLRLVIIDMQNIFSDQYPHAVWRTHNFHKIIPIIKRLADSGRYADRTLITRFVAGSDHKGSWLDYYYAASKMMYLILIFNTILSPS